MELGGSRLEQHGRNIFMSSRRSADEQRALLQRLKDSVPLLEQEIRVKASEIATVLSQHNSFDLIANASLLSHLNNPDAYRSKGPASPAFDAEYVALIALKRPYVVGAAEPIPSDVIQRMLDSAESVRHTLMFLQIARRSQPENAVEPTLIDDLGFAAEANEYLVRNKAYPTHLYKVLREMFAPFDRELEATLGFNATEATVLSGAISDVVSGRLTARFARGERFVERAVDALNGRRSRRNALKGIPPEWHEQLQSMDERSQRKTVRTIAATWITYALGQTWSVTPDDLARRCRIRGSRVKCFLNSLSTEFGSVEADFVVPGPDHILKQRPLIHHEGVYLCPSLGLLDWSIQPLLEATLKSRGGRTFDRYAKRRHDFLVEEGVAAIRRVLPRSNAATHLSYSFRTDGRERSGEVDALVQADSVLLIIEGKGGALTAAGKSGKTLRLESDLKKLVGEAFEQGRKVGAYMRTTPMPVFSGTRGRQKFRIRIRSDSVQEIIYVSLHLEPMGHITSLIPANETIGLFGGAGYPWMISLYDLLAITDVIEYEAQFPHYIMRRTRVGAQGFLKSHDELDYFGFYLDRGLYFTDQGDIAPAKSLEILSHTGKLDAYYLWQSGVRKRRARRPRQRIPRPLKGLLGTLQRDGIEGYLDLSMCLLDFGSVERDSFGRGVSEARRKFEADGRLHDISVYTAADVRRGITYMCGQEANLLSRLGGFCALKKHQMRADRWYGIADVGRKRRKVIAIARLLDPWRPDATMDELVRSSGIPEAKTPRDDGQSD